MDMETEKVQVQKPGMTKEQLQDSLSCRFCGYWSNVKESSSNVYFVPIFGLTESLQENLNILINRYLPIKVFDTDQYYPRFLCSTCVHDFKQTITFFNKIAAGQKILHEIINFTAPLPPPPPDPDRMTFSAENPITQAIPKKRGRPKKDPFQLPKEKPVIPEDYGKPRRTIRAPGRYGSADCTEVSIRLEVEESPTPEIHENKRPILYEDLLKKNKSKDVGDSDFIAPMETQSEFTSVATRENSVLDITRLNVIMDGDDEEPDVTGASQPNSDTENVQPKTVDSYDIFVLPDYPAPAEAIAPQEDEDPTDMDFKVEITKNNKIKVKRGRGRPKKKKRKPKQIIQCSLCDKSFGHPSSLRYHRITAHETSNSIKFHCEVCDRVFKHKNLLKCHMLAHSNIREFQCDQCTKAFKSRNSLQTHVKVIHLGIKFKCDLCDVQFSFKSSLIAHKRLHKGEKPFICEFCNKAFTQKSNLDEHLRVHTNKRPYECTICFKTFKTASQFRSHKFIHADEKSFLCSICGKSFTTRDHFKYHMRRHNGEQPIECSVCNRKFVEPYALTKHMRIHTGSKPYHCKICDRNFGDGSNFKKHMQRHGDYAPSSSGGEKSGKTRPRPPKLQGRVLELYTKTIAEVEEAEEAEVEAAEHEPSSSHAEAEPDVGHMTRKRRFFKNSEPLSEDQIQIRDVFSQGILTGDTLQPDDSEALTEEDGSLVQILNAEGLLENSSQDGQVIYVYPDDLPIFTITLNDNQQAIEVRANDETTLQALGNLTGGPITFATVDGSDLGTQYFNLESVDGTTLTVPSESSVGDMGEGMNLGTLMIPDSSSAGQTTLQLLQPESIATSISGHSSSISTDMNH